MERRTTVHSSHEILTEAFYAMAEELGRSCSYNHRDRLTEVALRDGFACYRCKEQETTMSFVHEVHQLLGGSCDAINTKLCCFECVKRHRVAAELRWESLYIKQKHDPLAANDAIRYLRQYTLRNYKLERTFEQSCESASYQLDYGDQIKGWECQRLCVLQEGRCNACGRRDDNLTLDHIVPSSRGGSSRRDNIQALCSTCNSKKGVIPWEVFLATHGYQQQFDLAPLWSQVDITVSLSRQRKVALHQSPS
jgi:HNH endonuclease